ncbi:MAG TPA: histidine kinase dimerization/phospho-acceptor domain-containing protein, partial [Burkholderiales bacterium]|nr:histidine kinase dimerization/phospho-acceptor domain-containing protein [Burkholderiales bacterium]
MEPEGEERRPERDDTDESLRAERRNTDEALADKRAGIEDEADGVVRRAREHADAVLDTARDKADKTLEATKPTVQAIEAVAGERARDDELLHNERVVADESLTREREEEARALAALLPLEREKTDAHLLTERVHADGVVANRDDFLGMVSHDLRNLLGSISLTATLTAKQASESDEGRRTISGMKRIQRNVARMNRLIGDLVDVASIDAGKLAMQPERGDAAALLREAVDAFAPIASESGISLTAGPVEGDLSADFDHDRMLQVCANLIANAIKFTPAGGRITASGKRVAGAIHLCVS